MEAARPDLRKQSEIRPLAAQLRPLASPDGSVTLSQGKTKVTASMYGPVSCPSRMEQIDKMTVAVSVAPLAGPVTMKEEALCEMIKRTVEKVVILSTHPRSLLQIAVQIVNDDGSLIATIMNAVCIALMDGGISCHSMFAGVAVTLNSTGDILLDPSSKEELASSSTATLVFTSTDNGLLTSDLKGRLTDDSLTLLIDRGRKASKAIFSFYSILFEKHLANLL